ncbi:ribosome hibernation-promoting factor, HPF/YfiA family [Murdochiella vaginalis]|uniref:ribosome hibernation-promoting factor, HPF/YfiA family n=1 Tax=Murdochiella vaginalis TaxID=1852373 RepID=UPI0008FE97C6|nr:ribosome-associated translation inhibitor RaiA [Murdochiella vaginalis]
MKIAYYGKNVNLRENTKKDIDKKVSRLNKYFREDVEARVTVSQEKSGMRCEITIPIPASGTILRADQVDEDLLVAVDNCISGLVSQIRKYKTKLERRRYVKNAIRFAEVEEPAPEEVLPEDVDIARTKEIEVLPMGTEEAVDQMELLGHDFFLYFDMDRERICCVYKRKAGNYGLLVPTK